MTIAEHGRRLIRTTSTQPDRTACMSDTICLRGHYPIDSITPKPNSALRLLGAITAISTASRIRRREAVYDRDPAAERDRRAAPGARPEQHAAGHPDPHEADAGIQHALDAGHRPCRDRHAGGRRTTAARKRRAKRGTTWAARSWSSGSGSGKTPTKRGSSSQLKQMGCSCDWQRTRFTLDDVCARAVRRTFFDLFQQAADLPRQAAGQLGHVPADRGQRRRGVPRSGEGPLLALPVSGDRSRSRASRRT